MIYRCTGCGSGLVYKKELGLLFCKQCGSYFSADACTEQDLLEMTEDRNVEEVDHYANGRPTFNEVYTENSQSTGQETSRTETGYNENRTQPILGNYANADAAGSYNENRTQPILGNYANADAAGSYNENRTQPVLGKYANADAAGGYEENRTQPVLGKYANAGAASSYEENRTQPVLNRTAEDKPVNLFAEPENLFPEPENLFREERQETPVRNPFEKETRQETPVRNPFEKETRQETPVRNPFEQETRQETPVRNPFEKETRQETPVRNPFEKETRQETPVRNPFEKETRQETPVRNPFEKQQTKSSFTNPFEREDSAAKKRRTFGNNIFAGLDFDLDDFDDEEQKKRKKQEDTVPNLFSEPQKQVPPARRTSADEQPRQETPVRNPFADEQPRQETPVRNPFADEQPRQETPVRNPFAGEQPRQETPVRNPFAGEQPRQETPVRNPFEKETRQETPVRNPFADEMRQETPVRNPYGNQARNSSMQAPLFETSADTPRKPMRKPFEPRPAKKENESKPKEINMKIYYCNSCGARVMVNEGEVATFCSFCAMPSVSYDRNLNQESPKRILPFKLSREQAQNVIKDRLGFRKYALDEIRDLDLDSVHGIYVPFWLFEVDIDRSMTVTVTEKLEQEKEKKGFDLKSIMYVNNEEKVTDYQRREVRTFEIFLDACKNVNDVMAERLEPYHLDQLQNFNLGTLKGHYADMYDVLSNQRLEDAHTKAQMLADEMMVKSCPGAKDEYGVRNPECNIKKKDIQEKYEVVDTEYIMLPAYFVSVRYRNQSYVVMVNGQTGKVVSNLPMDDQKIKKDIIRNALMTGFGYSACFLLFTCISIGSVSLSFLLAAPLAGMGYLVFKGFKAKKKYDESYYRMQSSKLQTYAARKE